MSVGVGEGANGLHDKKTGNQTSQCVTSSEEDAVRTRKQNILRCGVPKVLESW